VTARGRVRDRRPRGSGPRRNAARRRRAADRPLRVDGRPAGPHDSSRAFTIRAGRRQDCREIARLVRGLAHYERLVDECVITPRAVARDGFGRRPYFQTLLCRREGTAIGFALYFFTYSTFAARPTLYLEDLFVVPDERGRGAGYALLRTLARIAVGRGCARMEWTVLDWNAPSIAFYERLGATLRREWILTRLAGRALRRLATSSTP